MPETWKQRYFDEGEKKNKIGLNRSVWREPTSWLVQSSVHPV